MQVPCARCHFSAVTAAGDTCRAVLGDDPTIPAQEFHQGRGGDQNGHSHVAREPPQAPGPGKGTRLCGHVPKFLWMWQQGPPWPGELELLLWDVPGMGSLWNQGWCLGVGNARRGLGLVTGRGRGGGAGEEALSG